MESKGGDLFMNAPDGGIFASADDIELTPNGGAKVSLKDLGTAMQGVLSRLDDLESFKANALATKCSADEKLVRFETDGSGVCIR